MTHQFKSPLGDSSRCILVLDNLTKRKGCHHRHGVRLKVVAQFSLGDEDGVEELLDLGVAGLGVRQDLAYEVHVTLYYEGMPLFLSLHH